jgi:hypothetical protein
LRPGFATTVPSPASRDEISATESAEPPVTEHLAEVDLPEFMALIHAEFADAPSHSIVYRLLAGGRLPGWRVRGRWRLPAAAAKAALVQHLGLTPQKRSA